MKIFVGNLDYQVTEDDLRKEFAVFGDVTSVSIVTDRDSGRPRGFAFVEMANKSEAKAAIDGLNGKLLRDREVNVNESKPRTDRPGWSNRGGGAPGRGERGGGRRSSY